MTGQPAVLKAYSFKKIKKERTAHNLGLDRPENYIYHQLKYFVQDVNCKDHQRAKQRQLENTLQPEYNTWDFKFTSEQDLIKHLSSKKHRKLGIILRNHQCFDLITFAQKRGFKI